MRNPEFSENCRANRRERHNRVYLMDHWSLSATVRNSVPKNEKRERERKHLIGLLELIDERKGEKEKERFSKNRFLFLSMICDRFASGCFRDGILLLNRIRGAC